MKTFTICNFNFGHSSVHLSCHVDSQTREANITHEMVV